MEKNGEYNPFFPANYVTLKMLKESWEEDQRHLAQQKEAEEEEKAAAEASQVVAPRPATSGAARNAGAARGRSGSDKIAKDKKPAAGGASPPGKATEAEAVVRATGSGGAATNQKGNVNEYWKITKDNRPVAGGGSSLAGGGAAATNEWGSRGSGGVKSPEAAKGPRMVWVRKNPIE